MSNAYLINTEKMEWPIYEGDFRIRNSGNSYPSPLVNPPEPYEWVQYTTQPSFDYMTQGVKEAVPVKVENVWQQQWEVYALTPEQIAENEENARQANKSQAMQLLTDTDWTQMPDVDLVNKADFTFYRSELRAIALNPPVEVTEWPVKPDEQW